MAKRKNKVEQESGGEEDEFQVEEILAKKTPHGNTYYLIKWLNYELHDATWEQEDNVFCDDLIQKFEYKLTHDLEFRKKSNQTAETIPFPAVADEEEVEEEEEAPKPKRGGKKTPVKKPAATPKSPAKSPKKPTTPAVKKVRVDDNEDNNMVEKEEDDEPAPNFQSGDLVEKILGCKMLNELSFYVKWADKERWTYVTNTDMRRYQPQILIDFYQSRIQTIDLCVRAIY
ncbi:hypothetical protein SAMD00019534_063850 [Acytostelium subglobosum LB1]|uniref:hypothetical protein n=1 Tax=Acytostelium subglobosum LB1 TaxID=1410327 RepID=UPI000644FA71|nr:hypothetical protein SAMD00019534_063850 [Acytostelium subglobosum LB1]GAM23210.1 hypothetical protein SAMD00019534_063850 [Acytostelium subglobosum LB1]|eukprot:XP_012753659.1 hypothetical protein SAMD00019534_063850 [Acytostelium subglobosum LB1]